jgi:hypothetical protein
MGQVTETGGSSRDKNPDKEKSRPEYPFQTLGTRAGRQPLSGQREGREQQHTPDEELLVIEGRGKVTRKFGESGLQIPDEEQVETMDPTSGCVSGQHAKDESGEEGEKRVVGGTSNPDTILIPDKGERVVSGRSAPSTSEQVATTSLGSIFAEAAPMPPRTLPGSSSLKISSGVRSDDVYGSSSPEAEY